MLLTTAHLYLTPRFDQSLGFPVSVPSKGEWKPFIAVGSRNDDRIFYRLNLGIPFAQTLLQRRSCPHDGLAKLERCLDCGKLITPRDIEMKIVDECGYANTKPVAKHDTISWIPPVMNGNIIPTQRGLLLVEERDRDRYDRRVAMRLRVDGVSPLIGLESKSTAHDFIHNVAHGQIWAKDGEGDEKMVAVEKILILRRGDRVIVARTVKTPDVHERLTMEFMESDFKVAKAEKSDKPFTVTPMPYTEAELAAADQQMREAAKEAGIPEEAIEESIPESVSNEERGVGPDAQSEDPVEVEREAQSKAGVEMSNEEALEA